MILVACPQVAHIQEQPLTIWYAWRGTEDPSRSSFSTALPLAPQERKTPARATSCRISWSKWPTAANVSWKSNPPSRLARPIVQRKLAVGRAFAAQRVDLPPGDGEGTLPGTAPGQRAVAEPLPPGSHGRSIVLEQLVLQVPAGGIELGRLLPTTIRPAAVTEDACLSSSGRGTAEL